MNKLNYFVLVATLPAMLMTTAALAEKKGDHKGHNTESSEMHHMGDHGQREMLFKGLNLTDEQKTQIKAIRTKYKDGMMQGMKKEDMHKKFQADNTELKALIQSDKFDESAVRQLIQKQQEKHLNMRVERAKMEHEIFALLTPEQRTLLLQKQAERQQKREAKHSK